MYKRIVVAVDGSEASGRALDEAIRLAREMSAMVLLLHVCEEIPAMWEPDGILLMQGSLTAVADAGKELLEQHRQQLVGQGVAVEEKLVESYGGSMGGVISEEAHKWHADLLVMGTHGYKGITHLLIGSVAEGVIRTATMPVLVVRR